MLLSIILFKKMFVEFKKSDITKKKMTAIFYDDNNKKIKTTHFGFENPEDKNNDFTRHKDEARKQRYLTRSKSHLKTGDFKRAGFLSRWVLWNKPTLKASIKSYMKEFNLKPYKPNKKSK